MRKLPPLNSLVAFESAARHKSFSAAAKELGVTQGAISKQIKFLEEHLGMSLFGRKYQHIEPTEAALVYLSALKVAFDKIELATDQLLSSSNSSDTLIIDILPTLSSRWLIPQLEDFKSQCPNITVLINSGDGDIDFSTNTADLAIRISKDNNWGSNYSEIFMNEYLIPVCSPKLKVKSLDDLEKFTILQHTDRPKMWKEYLNDTGFGHIKLEHKVGLQHFFMLIEAAIDGIGIALVPKFLIEKELKNKMLIAIAEEEYKSPFTYQVIAPSHKVDLKKVRLFKDWLFKIARGCL